MKRHTPFMILMVLLLTCLVGCNSNVQNDPPTTEATIPTVPTTLPPETEPPIDPYALYQEAADAFPADITMAVFINREVRVADLVITSSIEQNITYLGRGTENFRAKVMDTSMYGDHSVRFSEIYADGQVYATMYNAFFLDEMDAEEFTARYAPTVLLDASHYETLEYDGISQFLFSGATAIEDWLLDEDAQIVSAEGSAIVANGQIVEATYDVTYTVGGAQITVEVEQLLSPPDNVTINAPASSGNYAPVEDFDAIKAVDQAYGYLLAADTLSGQVVQVLSSEHNRISLMIQSSVGIYDIGKSPAFRLDQQIVATDLSSGQQQGALYQETYRNKVYNMSENGNRGTPDRSVTPAAMRVHCQDVFAGHFPDLAYIQDAVAIDMGGIYLFEFTGSDALGDQLSESVCALIYGETDALSKKSSDYTNDTLEYYLSIDKYTGLPISLGLNYKGIYTLWGRQYAITRQVDCSFDLTAWDVYEMVTEEPPVETEPEEKATPLLYRVTGADGQEMWLFGTIHVGDSRTGFLPQEVYDAFAQSDALALEFDTEAFENQLETDASLSAKLAKYYWYTDGSTTADHISSDILYQRAVRMMKATGSYSANILNMKPILWSQEINNAFITLGNRLTGSKGMESRLLQLAKDQGKPILEVESALFQVEMLTGYSDPLQEMLLSGSVYSSARSYWESVHEMYELWCQGDEAALIKYIREDTSEMTDAEKELYDEYYQSMSFDRNKAMLDVAIGYLESGDTVFFSVGLAHLLAENGLVFALRDAGYTVELIVYN